MRTHLRVALFSSLILLSCSGSAYAQLPAEDHVVELGVMFWKPSPVLILSTDTLVGAGVNEVDFVQEFGIEDKYFPEFRATIGRNHKFRASFVTFDYDAETIITRTITFQGRTFTIGVPGDGGHQLEAVQVRLRVGFRVTRTGLLRSSSST